MSTDFPVFLPVDPVIEHPALGGYRVVHGKHGTALYGLVPLQDMKGIERLLNERGLTIFDVTLAGCLGATLVATTEEGSRLWRAELEERAAKVAGDDEELRWVLGTDTGRSSAQILHVLGTSAPARAKAGLIVAGAGHRNTFAATPQDADDFGRCVRLLDRFPAWRGRLHEVAIEHPEWMALVGRWTEIETCYREEVAGGTPCAAPRTNGMLMSSNGESEVTLDLSALSVENPETQEGQYFEVLDKLCETLVERHDSLPDSLIVIVPGGRHVRIWNRGSGVDPNTHRKGVDQ